MAKTHICGFGKGLVKKDNSDDEWEYVCRPHHTQFPKGVVIDEDL
jgi:hypothetical protein